MLLSVTTDCMKLITYFGYLQPAALDAHTWKWLIEYLTQKAISLHANPTIAVQLHDWSC